MELFNVFFISIMVVVLASPRTYKNQEEYEGFLNMIEQQRADERKGVEHDEFEFFNKEVYGRDRHGRPYIRCADFNSTAPRKVRTIRCPILGKSDRPGCFALYDRISNQVIQSCYNYQKEIAELCETNSSCSFANSARDKISFCCCVGDRCNAKEKVLMNGTTMERSLEDLFANSAH